MNVVVLDEFGDINLKLSKINYKDEVYSDFWIKTPEDHNIQGYVELCGMESPGLTSCWAIAEYVKGHLAF